MLVTHIKEESAFLAKVLKVDWAVLGRVYFSESIPVEGKQDLVIC